MDKPVDKVDNSAKSRIFNQPGAVVGLFAKQPLPGQVKTRLTPPLSSEEACRLYRTSLLETVARLQQTGLQIVICCAGDEEWFRDAFPGLPLLAQVGDGLGERMSNAVKELFAAAGGPVLLAGSDVPDLPVAIYRQVAEHLQSVDVATVPCRDGGYAVVGMRRLATEVFDGIPWSTPEVLEATRRRCQELELSYYETQSWDDIDHLEDLKRLVERSPDSATAQHIVTYLSGWL